jgi:hypothetical protein
VLVPVGIWLFAKFFPKRESTVFGFPEPTNQGSDGAGPRIRRSQASPGDSG